MFDKVRFRDLLKFAMGEDSVTDFAKKSKVNRTYLSKLLNLKLDSPPSPKIIDKIASKAKNYVSYEALMVEAGYIYDINKDNFIKKPDSDTSRIYDAIINGDIQKDIITLPVLGKISAGLPILAEENIEGYEPISRNILSPEHEYFYLRVTGDSMNQKMRHGDLVLIQKQSFVENGDIGVVIINGFDGTIKKIIYQDNIIQLLPMSTNSEHLPQIYDVTKTDVRIIGKAIYITSKL